MKASTFTFIIPTYAYNWGFIYSFSQITNGQLFINLCYVFGIRSNALQALLCSFSCWYCEHVLWCFFR